MEEALDLSFDRLLMMMIMVGRKCTLIFKSIDFHVCVRSIVSVVACVKFLLGVADLHVDELLVY